jgi:hypothetical protein
MNVIALWLMSFCGIFVSTWNEDSTSIAGGVCGAKQVEKRLFFLLDIASFELAYSAA